MKPTISIITIVKNDRGIAETLDGLEKQEKPAPTEIIVVDASAPALLEDIREKHPDVRWHQFVPLPGKKKTSIPEQRNVGIRLAQGDIVVFIDANCVPSPHWLSDLVAPILDGSETMAAGSVRAANSKTYVNIKPEDDEKDEYLATAPTINLAFKKETWEQAGGFDESFLFGSDGDFTWRCHKAGNRIRFVRSASVTHDWGSLKDEIKRSYRYGKARTDIFRKHPELLRELVGGNSYILIYTIYFLGLPLTLYVWWYPLIIVLAFLKNAKNHPFKTVFMNVIYTFGVWVELVKLFFSAIF
jgi:glycosyltransferase involved in cell wall biosynthesis